jgi:hypothetical protein
MWTLVTRMASRHFAVNSGGRIAVSVKVGGMLGREQGSGGAGLVVSVASF